MVHMQTWAIGVKCRGVCIHSTLIWHLLCGNHGGLEEWDRKHNFPSLNFHLELGRGLLSVTTASQQWAPCLECSVWPHQLMQVTHFQVMSVSSTLTYWSRMCYCNLLHIPVPLEAVQTDRAQLQDHRLLRSPNVSPGLSQVFSPVIWHFNLL